MLLSVFEITEKLKLTSLTFIEWIETRETRFKFVCIKHYSHTTTVLLRTIVLKGYNCHNQLVSHLYIGMITSTVVISRISKKYDNCSLRC